MTVVRRRSGGAPPREDPVQAQCLWDGWWANGVSQGNQCWVPRERVTAWPISWGRGSPRRLQLSGSQAASGACRLCEYIPDRSKQQGRRFPLASMSQALFRRFWRVSAFLAEVIQ